ncbi:hypothetical protein [Rhodopila sp.]|jgi:hypothetical protein|uniref:hypothetical protein n=1 Tax=Rhodopila sp. TaxID=2480087 RepID=UPI002CD29A04|nr:hypothetical protein [Rhodopila sp.]HVZ08760.1 hypothetical protein [Rhodopila sp.]
MKRNRVAAWAIAGMMTGVLAGTWGLRGAGASPTDPAAVEILGLRLGMTEPAVTAVLRAQRIRTDQIRHQPEACQGEMCPGEVCQGEMCQREVCQGEMCHGEVCQGDGPCRLTLTTPTPDGELSIDLAGTPLRVDRITYRLHGRGPGEPAIIADAVLERFGRPDEQAPMTWCRHPGTDLRCVPGDPVLRFYRDTLTLVLAAGRPRDAR